MSGVITLIQTSCTSSDRYLLHLHQEFFISDEVKAVDAWNENQYATARLI
jgi:hypothetical protein